MARRPKKKTGIGIISFVILMLFITLSYGMIGLKQEKEQKQIKMDRLQRSINQQEERKEEINELKMEVQTKQYVEKVAREKLGLVYKDEIIIKPEDEDKH